MRPMVSGRDYHATHHENDSLSTTATTVTDGLVSRRLQWVTIGAGVPERRVSP